MNAFKRFGIFLVMFLWTMADIWAQCATCKGQLMGEGNEARGAAVNQGILYLLALPYALVGLVGIVWLVRRNKVRKQNELEQMARLDSQVSAEKLYGEFPPSGN